MFDIHCHIVPGVDDGSRDMRESLAMLAAAKKAGIDHIVCTPHCRDAKFDYDLVIRQYDRLYEQAARQGIEMTLGFEVHWGKLAEYGIDQAPRLRIEGTDLILIEFSVASLPVNWQRIIYGLQGEGLTVIVAHPERYRPIQKNLDIAFELKEMGCLLQLSSNFVEGGRLSPGRKTALELLRAGLVDYVASDAHRVEDYSSYARALEVARKHAR